MMVSNIFKTRLRLRVNTGPLKHGISLLLMMWCCSLSAQETVPNWAADAVWYQIFPDRFRNGDTTNDPTRDSLDRDQNSRVGNNWKVNTWGGDWYSRSEWEQILGTDFYNDGVSARRYGGDLQGVIDELPYLEKLGVTAILRTLPKMESSPG